MDRCLWKVDPIASPRIAFLSTSDHFCSRNRIHSIRLPILHFHLNRIRVRPRLHQMPDINRLYRRRWNVLRLDSSLPIYLHAVRDLLPLLQHLEAIQKTSVHQPSIFDFSDHDADLPSVLDFLPRWIISIAVQPLAAPKWLQSILNGDDRSQYRMLLRIRKVLHWMVQPILRGDTEKHQDGRVCPVSWKAWRPIIVGW